MIVLHKFVPAWGLPDMSPFVIKVETYLKMTGTTYRGVVADSRKSPKGKFPCIEDEGRVIADSSAILAHLEAKAARPLDAGLSDRERAASAAFRGMLEEHHYFLVLWRRWVDDGGFAIYQPGLSAYTKLIGIPSLASPVVARVIRRDMRRTTWGQGVGRHSRAEIAAAGIAHLRALSDWLGDQPYFMGSGPRTIDATVFAFVASELYGAFGGPELDALRGMPNLVAYCERVRARYWADAWPA